MRALITMIAILTVGIASAQSYGPLNGVTFTVSGTTLTISGSSVNGDFEAVNLNFLYSLRPYSVETIGGSVMNPVTIGSDGIIGISELTSLGFSKEMVSDLSVFLDGTLVIYDLDDNIVIETDITDVVPFASLEVADGFSASAGYRWEIII